MTDHPDFDQLCDLADGALSPPADAQLRAHLSHCDPCSAQFAELMVLNERTAALPRDIAPPADLWMDIRDELVPRDRSTHAAPARRRWGQLIAAAALIAVVSSALTVFAMRANLPPRDQSAVATITPALAVLPAQLAADERTYTRSVEALERTLDQRRDSLAPNTIRIVEHSLRVADSAIAEARAALANDPANRMLERLFASNYERKIDLLRRATELAPRT